MVGNAVFNGDVGVTDALVSVQVSDDTTLDADITTTGSQVYGDTAGADTTTLGSNINLSASQVTFTSAVDGTTGSETITVTAGNLDFDGLVGDTNGVGDIDVTAGQLQVSAGGSIDNAGTLSGLSAQIDGAVGVTSLGAVTITGDLSVGATGSIDNAGAVSAATATFGGSVDGSSVARPLR